MESEKVKEIKKALASSFCSDIDYVVNIDGEPTMKRLWIGSVINLINELESENERLDKEKEDLRLFDIALGNGKVDMTLGGNTAKSFINAIVQIFEQNNATNFLATTIEAVSSGNKYSLIIQKENGQTPSEKLTELKDRIAELENIIKNNLQYSKGYGDGVKATVEVAYPKKLNEFTEKVAKRLINIKGIKEILDETLKEFLE